MTDRNVYGRTGIRRLSAVALVTYVMALLAWIALFSRWIPMPGVDGTMQLSDPGVPEAMALSNGARGIVLYLVMWGVMMVAMMFPSSARVFQLYADTRRDASKLSRIAEVAVFVAIYTLIWTLTGLVPLAVNAVVPIVAIGAERTPLFLGGTLLLLAAYQLSPYKYTCLHHCRSPGTVISNHSAEGVGETTRLACHFGVYDVGCCWTLMGLMVVVGSMNILWMAAIAVLLSLEQMAPGGETLAKGLGVFAGVSGVGVLAWSLV